MITVDQNGWDKATNGFNRGVIGPFDQSKLIDGLDEVVQYRDNGVLVMSMRVHGSMTDKNACECERHFELSAAVIDAVAFIYIPTQEEYEGLLDNGMNDDVDLLTAFIAVKEAEYLAAQEVG